jgi:hypothetical protein
MYSGSGAAVAKAKAYAEAQKKAGLELIRRGVLGNGTLEIPMMTAPGVRVPVPFDPCQHLILRSREEAAYRQGQRDGAKRAAEQLAARISKAIGRL